MKSTTVVVALVLIALGIAFGLVRLDAVDAESLRFLPAFLGVIAAVALLFIINKRSGRQLKARKRKQK